MLKYDWGGYYDSVKNAMTEEELKTPLTETDKVFQVLIELDTCPSVYKMYELLKTFKDEDINKLNSPLLDELVFFSKNKYFKTDSVETIKYMIERETLNFTGRIGIEGLLKFYKNYEEWATAAVTHRDCVNILKTLLCEKTSVISYGIFLHKILPDMMKENLNLLTIAIKNNSVKCVEYLCTFDTYELCDALEFGLQVENVEIIKIITKYPPSRIYTYPELCILICENLIEKYMDKKGVEILIEFVKNNS